MTSWFSSLSKRRELVDHTLACVSSTWQVYISVLGIFGFL